MKPLTKEQNNAANTICSMYDNLRNLFYGDGNKTTKEAYCAIPIWPGIVRTLFQIKNTYPDYKTFIDIGCGKGSAMLLAKMAQFEVKGIELREEYKDILYSLHRKENITIGNAFEILKTYQIPDKSVIYIYRPIPDDNLMNKLTKLAFKIAPKGTIFFCYGCPFSPKKTEKLRDYTYLKL